MLFRLLFLSSNHCLWLCSSTKEKPNVKTKWSDALWPYRWVSSEQLPEMVYLWFAISVTGDNTQFLTRISSCMMHNVSMRNELWWGICEMDTVVVTIYVIHSESFLLHQRHLPTSCSSFHRRALREWEKTISDWQITYDVIQVQTFRVFMFLNVSNVHQGCIYFNFKYYYNFK